MDFQIHVANMELRSPELQIPDRIPGPGERMSTEAEELEPRITASVHDMLDAYRIQMRDGGRPSTLRVENTRPQEQQLGNGRRGGQSRRRRGKY